MSKSEFLNRKGRIEITLDIINNEPELIAQVLSGAVIFRAECMHMFNKIVYDCIHPEFDVLEVGQVVPDYDISIDTNDETGELEKIEFIKR